MHGPRGYAPLSRPLLLLLLPLLWARTLHASVCNPALYDRLARYTNITDPGLLDPCETQLHPGCHHGLQYPQCDTRFVPFEVGEGIDLSATFVSTCNECRAGWYSPPGPTSRVCSVNGGPGLPGQQPFYYEQRVCLPCTTVTGACTQPGFTLEVCSRAGRVGDALCIQCTNGPQENAVYTGPSPGNLNQCPYACAPGYYIFTPDGGQPQCRSCDADPCGPGFYRARCDGEGDRGECIPCTGASLANTNPNSYRYDTAGAPSDQDNCVHSCTANFVLLASGECAPLAGLDLNACGLGEELVSGQCTPCSSPPPANARYDLDDGSGRGGLCSWQCNGGFYRDANGQCQPHTVRQCARGEFLATSGNRTHDSLCAPCGSFPPSMDALASYRGAQDPGSQLRASMCVWDCKVGYSKAEGGVPACVRCQNKPLNAEYVELLPGQPPADHESGCNFECSYDTYNAFAPAGDFAVGGDRAPCNPRAAHECAADTSCLAEPGWTAPGVSITRCTKEPTAGAQCHPTHYSLKRLVNKIHGYTTDRYVAIASGHSGSLIYVALNHAIFSVSTFQGLEGFGGSSYEGSGMTLIAGDPESAASGLPVDSPLGVHARFSDVLSMRESADGRRLLVIDNHYGDPGAGWLRSIDITTRDYAVETLSGVGEDTCSNDTFVNPEMVDVLHGTPWVMVIDAECMQVHTYNMDTRAFLLTAGKAGYAGTSVGGGACHGTSALARLGSLKAGVWNTDGDMFIALTTGRKVMRISRPNTPECMVAPLNPGVDNDIWAPGGSWHGMALYSQDRILVAASMEVILYDAADGTSSRIVGQHETDFGMVGWTEGVSCHARMAEPTGLLLHSAGQHGGDSALYLADSGWRGVGPSIWRLSMPCPDGWYWSGDGECSRTLPGRVCRSCGEDTSTCTSASLTDDECRLYESCQDCYEWNPCSGTRDGTSMRCSNGPVSNVTNFRYTSAPPPGTDGDCGYACLSGFAGLDCVACPQGPCQEAGRYRGPCGGFEHLGSCSMTCTPIANALFTGGAFQDDSCPFECVDDSFFVPSNGRARECRPCSSGQACGVGEYAVACTRTMDRHCLGCGSFIRGSDFRFTGPGLVDDDRLSCPMECNTGFYLYNNTANDAAAPMWCYPCAYSNLQDELPGYLEYTGPGLMNTPTSCPSGCADPDDVRCTPSSSSSSSSTSSSSSSSSSSSTSSSSSSSSREGPGGDGLTPTPTPPPSSSPPPEPIPAVLCGAGLYLLNITGYPVECTPCAYSLLDTDLPSHLVYTGPGPMNTPLGCPCACIDPGSPLCSQPSTCKPAADCDAHCPDGQYREACTVGMPQGPRCLACTAAPYGGVLGPASPFNQDSCAVVCRDGWYQLGWHRFCCSDNSYVVKERAWGGGGWGAGEQCTCSAGFRVGATIGVDGADCVP